MKDSIVDISERTVSPASALCKSGLVENERGGADLGGQPPYTHGTGHLRNFKTWHEARGWPGATGITLLLSLYHHVRCFVHEQHRRTGNISHQPS